MSSTGSKYRLNLLNSLNSQSFVYITYHIFKTKTKLETTMQPHSHSEAFTLAVPVLEQSILAYMILFFFSASVGSSTAEVIPLPLL